MEGSNKDITRTTKNVSVLRQGEGYTVKYSLRPREIPRAKLYFTVYPDLSHNKDILNYNSSIVLPGRAISEELILRNALAAGALFSPSSTPSSTGSVLENIAPTLLGVYFTAHSP